MTYKGSDIDDIEKHKLYNFLLDLVSKTRFLRHEIGIIGAKTDENNPPDSEIAELYSLKSALVIEK